MIIIAGITDAVEYQFVNRTIYHRHNFPDILNRTDYENLNFTDAFKSGIICGQVLFITFMVKVLIMSCLGTKVNEKNVMIHHLKLLFYLILGNGIILLTDNRNLYPINRNHILMYILFFIVEFKSFFYLKT